MKTIHYRAGYKYQLAADYEDRVLVFPRAHVDTDYVVLSIAGDLIIRRGYAWDGPSGPTVDTANFMRGSLVHDALYQLIRLGHLDPRWKDRADVLLREMCLADGMSAARAWWVYHGVATFGGASVKACNEPPILTAP